MRFALMTEPQQGLSYDEILAAARAAEDAGLEAFFRSDHYASFPGPTGQQTTDAWTTLAGLARETTRIHLGVLVSPVTFRIPGSFAKVIQTVDGMSGGRIEVGLGAGWNEAEHAQLGIPFPPLRERVDMLAEELRILRGLWHEPDGWSFDGDRWQVRGSRRHGAWPDDRRPNLILGGSGKPRMAALAARYADEFNVVSGSPEECAATYDRVRRACDEIGRDPAQLTYSAMVGVLVGRDARELDDRFGALRELLGVPPEEAGAWRTEHQRHWIMGSPEEARERVAALARGGVQRVMLQDLLPRDLEHVRLLGEVFAG